MRIVTSIRSYIIRSSPWMFRDTPERIDYHVGKGDYLPLLATMMGFMEEALRNNDDAAANDRKTEIALKLARELRQDLRYVGAHYELTPRGQATLTLRSGNVLAE
ncbi:MAG: hypothetical protein V4644_01310 [Patescibacteria group bacterium]